MDVGLKQSNRQKEHRKHPCFNPCFNGCRPEAASVHSKIVLFSCFNPCFNGCRSEAFLNLIQYPPTLIVSILVLMDVGLKLSDALHIYNVRQEVSILVLMDVGLKPWPASLSGKTKPGFNPCFNGCRSEAISAAAFPPGAVGFQSLF